MRLPLQGRRRRRRAVRPLAVETSSRRAPRSSLDRPELLAPGAGARRRRAGRAPRPLRRPRLRRRPGHRRDRRRGARPLRATAGRLALAERRGRHRAAPRADGRRRRRGNPRGARRPRRRRLAGGARRRALRSRRPTTATTSRSASLSRSCSLTCSRIRSSARRRMRETCICEWPICSAICDCVMSSTKRRRSTSRSRSSRWGRAASRATLPSTSSKFLSSSPIQSAGVASSESSRLGRPVERERPAVVVGLDHLEHVGRLQLEPLGDLADRGRALQLLGQLGDRFLDLGHAVVQAARHPHGPDPVAEVAFELAEDGRRGEGAEGDAAVGVEAVDGVDQGEAGDLQEVVEGLAGAPVAARQAFGEVDVPAHQLLADRRIAGRREPAPELAFVGEVLLRPRRGRRLDVLSVSHPRHRSCRHMRATRAPALAKPLGCQVNFQSDARRLQMAYSVPDLPYAYDALEPHIDEATMRVHHDKHHQAYVDKANAALEGTEWADKDVEEVLKNLSSLPDDKQGPVRNNGGGHYNHSLFWQMLSPDGGGEPGGELGSRDRRRLRLLRLLQGRVQRSRHRAVRLGLGLAGPRRLGPGRGQNRRTRTRRSPTARRRCSAATSGSTPTTSSTRTSAPTTSTPSGTSSTGTTSGSASPTPAER